MIGEYKVDEVELGGELVIAELSEMIDVVGMVDGRVGWRGRCGRAGWRGRCGREVDVAELGREVDVAELGQWSGRAGQRGMWQSWVER